MKRRHFLSSSIISALGLSYTNVINARHSRLKSDKKLRISFINYPDREKEKCCQFNSCSLNVNRQLPDEQSPFRMRLLRYDSLCRFAEEILKDN